MAISVPRGKVLAAYRIKEANPGISNRQVAIAVGIKYTTVVNWLQHPGNFDPYYDRVAVLRAVAGDGEALSALTYYEYRLVIGLLERADTNEEPVVERFPLEYRNMVGAAVKNRRMRVEGDAMVRALKERKRSPEFDARVLELHAGGVRGARLAREVGCSQRTIRRIINATA